MKIKVNDMVKVLSGEDKGKTGKVLKTLKAQNKVVVEGVNISKRHTKPRTTNENGGIFEIEMPIHVSNVKLVDKKDTKKETKKVEAKKEEKTEVKKTTAKKTSTKKEVAKDTETTKKTTKKASK